MYRFSSLGFKVYSFGFVTKGRSVPKLVTLNSNTTRSTLESRTCIAALGLEARVGF